MLSPVVLTRVTFVYPSASLPLFDDLSLSFSPGWTGVIGANGAGKSTLLRLVCGDLPVTSGTIRCPEGVVFCPQRTDEPDDALDAFLEDGSSDAGRLRSQLRIEYDWPERWDTLSHGERKRAQIAVALWQRPGVLALDEPTNHIDASARHLLERALREYEGVGLLVSHDRALLDSLCSASLFLDPPDLSLRPGGYTKAVELEEAEADRNRSLHEKLRKEQKRLEREVKRRAREAADSQRKRSKRGISKKDHDAKSRIDAARVSGKDGQAGRVLRQMNGRLDQARQQLDAVGVKKRQMTGLSLSSAQAGRAALLRLPAGEIPIGSGRLLVHDELVIGADDRIALMGPNGSGKSTLIRHLVERFELPEGKAAYIPQEIPLNESRGIVRQARELPGAKLGELMSVVSNLGSSPQRLLETDEPSPGELRKLLLALEITQEPWVIVLDEPTNHLDLPSITCLEEALGECASALVLVSHDERFCDALATRRWEIRRKEEVSVLEETLKR